MNKQRRAQLNALQDRLTALKIPDLLCELRDIVSDLQTLRDEEQDAFDNLPESLQAGEKGETMDTAINAMTEAADMLEQVDDLPYDEIFEHLENAKGQA